MDQDLQKQLQEINGNLIALKNKKQGIWRSFFHGMFSALGYVAGLALVIVILGWVLNKTGLMAAFQQQIKDFQAFMNQARQVMNIGSGQQGTSTYQTKETTVTLPDGRQVKVQLPQ